MAHSYWTYCMYCGEIICGVAVLDESPAVVALYAHKTCYERHTNGRAITAASGGERAQEVPADLSSDAGTGTTDTQL